MKGLGSFGELSKTLIREEKKFSTMKTISPTAVTKMFYFPV